MISKRKLSQRVSQRRHELEHQAERLSAFQTKLTDFVNDIKSRSVIYNLIRNLSVWNALEELLA